MTANTTSTFAATICSAVLFPAPFRDSFVRRGSTSSILPAPRVHDHPVPEARNDALVPEPAGQTRPDLTPSGRELEQGARSQNDSGRLERVRPSALARIERLGKEGIPAVVFQRHVEPHTSILISGEGRLARSQGLQRARQA
jgi:hypothetical protein